MKIENPESFKEGCELITNVSPNGNGLKIFLAEILTNQDLINSTIYIIDVSGSFINHFGEIINRISQIDETNIHEFILFSDEAVKFTTLNELKEFKSNDNNLMGHGTKFNVALEMLNDNLLNEQFDCILYSDCQFSANELSKLKELTNDGILSIVEMNDYRQQ